MGLRRALLPALGLAGALGLGALRALGVQAAPPPRPVPLGERFGEVPWIRVVPQLAPLSGVGGVRAEDCGRCHKAHYEEWRRSTHAHAYTDLQFQSELGKDSSPRWLCLNCHLPVENQRDEVVRALAGGALFAPLAERNPGFDAALRDEGVTCATCHLRRDAEGRTYVLGPLGGTKPPHPVRVDRAALLSRCDDCHDQQYRLTPQLVCAFQTAAEVAAGPERGRPCASCHLPAERRPLTTLGTPPRTAHRHDFVGGPVPKRFERYDAQLARAFRPALDLAYEARPAGPGRLAVSVELHNARAAHRAPTGDPERYYEIELQLLDEKDRLLGRQRLRIGQLWRWSPEAKILADNRVLPGERRRWRVTLAAGVDGQEGYAPGGRGEQPLPAPPGAGAPARVRVLATHVRLSEENLAYMKRTAASADPRFAPQIAHLEAHYPTRTRWFESELALGSGARRTVPTERLLLRQGPGPAGPAAPRDGSRGP